MDFSQIRDLQGDQRLAFEELVCQLARREDMPPGAVFRRIEGSGGDGGVEGYWQLPNGELTGYQAKFFLRSGEIDWTQIDRSVEQALTTHPSMTQYIVALPCDLTDRSGAKHRGRTGWEQWRTRCDSWTAKWVAPAGRTVEFVPWTAFELRDRLTAPKASGLRRFWFGIAEFSETWFREHIRLAIAALNERYHPEDHVDVRLDALFSYLTRDQRASKAIHDKVDDVVRLPLPCLRSMALRSTDYVAAEIELTESLKVVGRIQDDLAVPRSQGWDAKKWLEATQRAKVAVRAIKDFLWDQSKKPQDDKKIKEEFEIASRRAYSLADAIETLAEVLEGKFVQAEGKRDALLVGRAGSGKSHLIGSVAEKAVAEGRPVFFLLGQQFNGSSIWDQIASRLGLPGLDADSMLQALDAAAQAAGKRGLILIDAVNEGAGAKVWRHEVAAFLARVRLFENLVCVLSCRTEYVSYVFPQSVLDDLQRFTIRGFETYREQHAAARVYLDRRGITRPSTPWIAPEFVNPLFLRSVCIALQRNGQATFPRGLRGTKEILAFYLDSVARNLGVGRDGSNELVSPTRSAILDLARQMAANRADFLALAEAAKICDNAFRGHAPESEQTWLDVLLRNGLMRRDLPAETPDSDDPFTPLTEVVRFSFQRFQDHLMAEALLEDVQDVQGEFLNSGRLSFMLAGRSIEWEWSGLLGALSIQIPERFQIELVDALPGGRARWWRRHFIVDAFGESVKWRRVDAFTDQTLELLNACRDTHIDLLGLMLEVSASVNHPWNAEMLHRNLMRYELPQRDAIWTVWTNQSSDDPSGSIGRIIDWSRNTKPDLYDPEAAKLCSIVLCWLFTSSNRRIRDAATKALTHLLINQSPLFTILCEKFAKVDDPYVTERLFAAAYGAACIEPTRGRLESFSRSAYELLFSNQSAPLSLSLRDYGRGIIELARSLGYLPPDIVYEYCIPPYGAAPPRLRLAKLGVERVAERAGDSTILDSCHLFSGDFGQYEIKSHAYSFTRARLSRPGPVADEQAFRRFEEDVISSNPQRQAAVDDIRSARSRQIDSPLLAAFSIKPKPESHNANNSKYAWKEAEKALLRLLSKDERIRYRRDARSFLGFSERKGNRRIARFDPNQLCLWVAKRAYQLGWKKQLFQSDHSHSYSGYSRRRPDVERIGKKYQWIALSELLCRLADNYWLNSDGEEGPKKYKNPTDLGFWRDIDPTVLGPGWDIDEPQDNAKPDEPDTSYRLQLVSEEALAAWPFKSDPAQSIETMMFSVDHHGSEWLKLYEHRSKTERYDTETRSLHGTRRQKFHFLMCVLVRLEDLQPLAEHLTSQEHLHVDDWDPIELTNGAFLREHTWRSELWPDQWFGDSWRLPKGLKVSFPVCRYHWESHLDASLPNGANAKLLAPWLSDALGSTLTGLDEPTHVDKSGSIVFRHYELPEYGSVALVSRPVFDAYLKENKLGCMWIFVAERSVWPGGDNHNAAWRRSEGVCWIESGAVSARTWKRDNANGDSAIYLPNAQSDAANKSVI